jgi:hypothetical protein
VKKRQVRPTIELAVFICAIEFLFGYASRTSAAEKNAEPSSAI